MRHVLEDQVQFEIVVDVAVAIRLLLVVDDHVLELDHVRVIRDPQNLNLPD
jgi:hypothetical protein